MKHGLKKFLLAALVALVVAPVSAQMSVFNKNSNLMTLQLVKAGQFYFSKMLLTLPVPPVLWSLDDKGVPVNPLNAADAALYNKSAGTLTVPVLKIDSTVYSNVKLALPDPDNNPSGASWSLVDLGNVMSTSSPGYDLSYPIVGTMPNKYCTDSTGELSYLINVAGSTKPQVWKHVADDPCCPLSVTTSSKQNIDGVSDVQIYPNSGEGPSTGNFRMMVTYTGLISTGATTSTCAKNVTDAIYAGGCVTAASGSCVADTQTPASTACVSNDVQYTAPPLPTSTVTGVATGTGTVNASNQYTGPISGTVTDPATGSIITVTGTLSNATIDGTVSAGSATVVGAIAGAITGITGNFTGTFSGTVTVIDTTTSTITATTVTNGKGTIPGTCSVVSSGVCKADYNPPGGTNNTFCTSVNIPFSTNNQYCSIVSTSALVPQTGVETCVVRPVIDVSNYPVGSNRAALAVSSSKVGATVGQRSTVYISGGLPPYFVTASLPGVVSYELLTADSTGIGQPLVIDGKTVGTTQLTVFDYNGTALPIAVESASIPLYVSPSSIDVPEGTLIDVRIEGGVPPLTVYNPTPAWVEAPATIATTPITITIAMKKSSGSSKTFLRFTDAAGTSASIGEIKISASTSGSTVLPSAITLKVGESSLIYVTGGTAPVSILNTRPDLMDIPGSLDTTPGTVRVVARKSTSGQAIPIYFTDKYGIQNTVSVTITAPGTILQ